MANAFIVHHTEANTNVGTFSKAGHSKMHINTRKARIWQLLFCFKVLNWSFSTFSTPVVEKVSLGKQKWSYLVVNPQAKEEGAAILFKTWFLWDRKSKPTCNDGTGGEEHKVNRHNYCCIVELHCLIQEPRRRQLLHLLTMLFTVH